MAPTCSPSPESSGAGLFVYGVILARRQRRPGSAAGNWRVLAIVAAAVVIAVWLHRNDQQKPLDPRRSPCHRRTTGRHRSRQPRPGRRTRRPAVSFTWLEVVALAAASLIAVAAATRPRRAGTGWTGRTADDAFAALVDDSLEDLRAEPDPRRAVIAAYARMERGLGASGLVRAPAETPLEYLARVLADRRVSPGAASRLTALFERAKFSDHPVAEGAKQDAIAALVAIRDELRARAQPGDPTVAGRP